MSGAELTGITNAITMYGFPIVAYLIMWKYMTGKFEDLVNRVTKVVDRNTEAITAGSVIIQHCKEGD